MTRSSRHKLHKQSKHSSKNYSESDEDVKMKEKSRKDENLVKVGRESAPGEKRKSSSHVREGKEGKDSSHVNGEASEVYYLSKRRKEKADVGGDRWNGGEEETSKGESFITEFNSKEGSGKHDNLRVESKNKSKKYESESGVERKDESLASVTLDKEEIKSKGDPKRKSDRGYSGRKDGKESKDKDNNVVLESKHGDIDVKLVDMDVGKKQGSQLGDLSEEKQGKRVRENTDIPIHENSRNFESEKELEKRIRRRRESSSDRAKYHADLKEDDEMGLSSRIDRAKDVKHRDDKHKDVKYSDTYQEDRQKDDRQKKYEEEPVKDSKQLHRDEKYRVDSEKDARRRDDRHREDRDKPKDEKHRENGDKYNKRNDEKYKESYERDGDRDDRRRGSGHREDVNKDNKRKEEKYREDNERESRHKDSSKPGDDFEREKKFREVKYRDERATTDRSLEKSDPKRLIDDGYADDSQSRKSNAGDESPPRDDRMARYREDNQRRRRTNEQEDYSDIRSRRDQIYDGERKSASAARMDSESNTNQSSRRHNSPGSSSIAPRERFYKQDDSKYRDPGYEDRLRQNTPSNRDYNRNSSSRSLDKLGKKEDLHFKEFSPSPNPDKTQFRTVNSRDLKGYSGKEPSLTDHDSLSVSSPVPRNTFFPTNSKPFPPPHPEDNSRFTPNTRYRRAGEPNMARMQSNSWRGVAANWPSPVANGFIPYPHGPPPVNFHSLLQPFPSPPMFGLGPYHMPDVDRFSSLARPTGFSGGSVFRDESHIYGRASMDPPSNRVIDKAPSLEMESSERESNEQTYMDQETEKEPSYGLLEKNAAEDTMVQGEDTATVDEILEKDDDVPFCRVYLSKLDMSAELTEPELLNRYTGFIDADQSMISDVHDSTILFMEEGVEAKVAPPQILSFYMSASMDDTVFQKAVSLYKRQKDNFRVINGDKQENLNVKYINNEKTSSDNNSETALQKSDLPFSNTVVKLEEPDSVMEDIVEEKLPSSVEIVEGYDGHLPADTKMEELEPVETKFGTFHNSDVLSSEAMMPPESVVSLSRIHHSPESTH